MLGGSRFPDTALELRTKSPEQEEGLPIRLSYSSETVKLQDGRSGCGAVCTELFLPLAL
jgi:hypothetical protein